MCKKNIQEKPSSSRRLARIRIKQNTENKKMNELRAKHHSLLLLDEWRFNFDEYQKTKIGQLLELSEKMLITQFYLRYSLKNIDYSKQSTIVKELSHIDFPKLKSLYLCGNSIKNLEGLASIDMPLLQNLFLRNNLITSLRPLRRCCFKPVYLDLSENKLIFLDNLWSYLNLQRLQQLFLNNNPNAILTYSYIKSSVKFSRIGRLALTNTDSMNIEQHRILLSSLGVQYISITNW